jgi:hypothetical protein
MKKFSFILLAFVSSLFINAQITGGSWVLMGGGGYFSNTSKSEGVGDPIEFKFNQGFLDFGGMYLFTDNIGAGLALTLDNSVSLTDGNKTSSAGVFGLQLMGRYYSPCMAPRFYAFGQVDLGFGTGSSRIFDNDGEEIESLRDNISQIGFGIRPGIAYFLTPAVMLEASFGALAWQQQTFTNNENNDVKDINSSLDFFAFSKSLTFGFCWWLGRSGDSF